MVDNSNKIRWIARLIGFAIIALFISNALDHWGFWDGCGPDCRSKKIKQAIDKMGDEELRRLYENSRCTPGRYGDC